MICWQQVEPQRQDVRLVEELGGEVVKVLFLVELPELEWKRESYRTMMSNRLSL